MKRTVMAAALAAVMAANASTALSAKEGPAIDAVFVLDTTGSMGGLLDGAKRKIWSIANEMAKGKPTPRIRIGLVAYRDKGDAYVTQVTDLTEDLDRIYETLQALSAGGGGDGPEDVKAGLEAAVKRMTWSKGGRAAKLVFLVGDAPGHLEYTETPALEEILKSAMAAGLRINTIRCGADATAGEQFQRVAALGEGKYFSIGSDGGVASVETPFDRELAEADRRIGGSMLAFGARKDEALAKRARVFEAMAAAPMSAAADRAEYAGAKGGGFGDGADLLDALDAKSAKLEDIKEADLPAELQGKSTAEKERIVAAKRAERAEARKKVAELSKKRDAWLKDLAKKSGKKDAFDAKVMEAIRDQAKDKGIAY